MSSDSSHPEELALALLKQKQKHQLEMLMLQQEHELLLEQAKIKQALMEKKQAEMQAAMEAKMAALGMQAETKQAAAGTGAGAPPSSSSPPSAAAPLPDAGAAPVAPASQAPSAKIVPAEVPAFRSAVIPGDGRYATPGLYPEPLIGKMKFWKGSTFGVIEVPAPQSIDGQHTFQFHVHQMSEGVLASALRVGTPVEFKIWVNDKLQKFANCVRPAVVDEAGHASASFVERSAALKWRRGGDQQQQHFDEKENQNSEGQEGVQQAAATPQYHGSPAVTTATFGPGAHDAWMRGMVSWLASNRGLIAVHPEINGSREVLFHASKAEVSMDQLTVGSQVEFKLFVDDQLKLRANQVRLIGQQDAAAAAAAAASAAPAAAAPKSSVPPGFGAGAGAGVSHTPSPSAFTPARQASAPGGPALFETFSAFNSPGAAGAGAGAGAGVGSATPAHTPQSVSADSEQARLRKQRLEEAMRRAQAEIEREDAEEEKRRKEQEQADIEAAFAPPAAEPQDAQPAKWSSFASKLASAPVVPAAAAPAAAPSAAAKPSVAASGPQLYPGMLRGTFLHWKDASLGVVTYGESKQTLCHVDQLLCSPSDLSPGLAIQFVLFQKPDGRQFAEGVQPLGWTPTTGMAPGFFRGVIRYWIDEYHCVISTRMDGLQRDQIMFHRDQRAQGVRVEDLTDHTRVTFRVYQNPRTGKRYANDVAPLE